MLVAGGASFRGPGLASSLAPMRFHYINLDGATARRDALEANFRAAVPGRELVRFPAIAGADLAEAAGGTLSAAETGCFFSHRELLATRDPGQTIFVLEDDAVVSHFIVPVVEAILATSELDVLYTDLVFPDRNFMLNLAWRRREHTDSFFCLDLKTLAFAGATAYAVRAEAREKLSALLAADPLDLPFDLALRRLVATGELRGGCVFPFVTTLADSAASSQIQVGDKALRDLPLNLFRRLMYIERDMGRCVELARQMEALMCDDEARVAGAVFAGMASAAYADGQKP